MRSNVFLRAEQLVSSQQYTAALELLEKKIGEIHGRINPSGTAAVMPARDSYATSVSMYIAKHPDEPFTRMLCDALEMITLTAAAVELCVLSLGRGAEASGLIISAGETAGRFPPPFHEMLMSHEDYFRMMWYYYIVTDKDTALRNAYRIASRYPGSLTEYRCRDIVEAEDWDRERCRSINFYLLFPDQDISTVTEHTLLPVPAYTESYDAAVCDSVLSSLERKGHTKKNDDCWMQLLFYMMDDVRQILGKLPMDKLDNTERTAQCDRILSPLSGHVVYQQTDGFKTGYKNSAKVALKRFGEKELAGTDSVRRIREALEGGGNTAGAETKIRTAGQDTRECYFISDVFKDRRVFLSSSFRDMIAERDYLLTFIFPDVDMYLREFGMRLTPVDLRGIKLDGSEEGYNRECFSYCLSEIDRSDSMIGLIGDRYGSVLYDGTTSDAAMEAVVTRTAHEHGVTVTSMTGKSITHIEMMYGLKVLNRNRCYFYIRNVNYTAGAGKGDLWAAGFDDGQKTLIAQRQKMITDAYGVSRIAPENEPGSNIQYYNATFDGKRFSGLDGLGANIRRKLYHDCVFGEKTVKRDRWHTRILSFWSDMAHQTIPHPRLQELLDAKEQFIFLTGPEGIGKTVLLAQYWEKMRNQVLVLPVEALLETECNSFKALSARVDQINGKIRLDLPKDRMWTKEAVVILDGIERLVGRGKRLNLLENYKDSYKEGVRVIVCAQEQALSVPDYFRVIRLTDPPAAPADLIRNTAYRAGKRLDEETVGKLAEIAERGKGNPLYTELITKRTLYLLQDEYVRDNTGWFDKLPELTDGTIRSAGDLMKDRAVLVMDDPKDKELARAAIREVSESEYGSLSLIQLITLLSARGNLPPMPKAGFSGSALNNYLKEQRKKLLRIITMLKPVLLFDHSAQNITLAHRSLIGSGSLAAAQKEILEKAEVAETRDGEQKEISGFWLMAAAIAAVFAGLLCFFPWAPGKNIRTAAQVFAMALLFAPLGKKKGDYKNNSAISAADLLAPPLYWIGVVIMAMTPVLILSDSIPDKYAAAASGFLNACLYLVTGILSLHCLSMFLPARKQGRKTAVLLIAALAAVAASAAGLYSLFALHAEPSLCQPVSMALMAIAFIVIGIMEKRKRI